MNRIFLLGLLILSGLSFSFGQTTQSFHYQSILRDLTGTVVSNEDLGIQVSIIQTFPNYDTVYAELFTKNSGFSGQIDLAVGQGDSISGDYNSIKWGQGSFVIDVAIALGGGSNYTITNTQPLTSVPYSIWSNTAGGAQSTRAVKRDKITNPQVGQLVFCSDCGDGELQVYNGIAWVNVAGNAPQPGSVLVQQLFIELLNPYGLNQQLADKSFPLTARALPDSAADKSVKWSVLETDIATIDQNGILVLLDTGRVTVTAEANDCGGAKATFSYRFVDQKLGNSTPVGVTILGDTAIFINETSLVLAQLDTMFELDTFATWQSFDTTIASISNKGIITAKALGVTQIEVTSSVNTALKDTIPLHVREKQEPFNLIYPTIVVDGFDGDTNLIFIQRYTNEPFPGITAIDDIEDTITHIANLYDISFNAASYDNQLIKDYILIVSASDTFGNNTIDTLNIEVGDRLPPEIMIEGGLTTGDTITSDNIQENFLPTAFALDEDGDTISVSINA
ncbi:MAG: Ig-like domain-containing protein, partial [Bacteroidia bacterium]|nr:Ig-like domain-containing protein [Bacteroidia bacterium]